jgi:hypothetical protein
LALLGSIAGLEIAHPIALVLLGGLVTSTLYTLVGVPALYLLFGEKREAELDLLPITHIGEEEMLEVTSRAYEMNKVK